ncbi:replication-relaxation family protein [Frankia sp. AgB1.9]|uniref:replication-relaxation family protein n=1 Tax=unclassified Frankia TaxID=2632575 RepID=UPI0019320ECD|nr:MULTISPECIES: replication-relaxation family protein [unclassified Frankia]MBL7491179.1 replication-relaxation family protein [Frankia sp. AgW1.1]MBL7553708.1 replication-relaxation family protein [Frankia sp. AgB1.9]MBL7618002.1 replication-relaxation family protein [Frankia sp. AgB1.8]
MTAHRAARPAADRLVWEAGSRLTPRDRWLLAMLAEHQVLTGAQITQLAYTNPRTAQSRLALLHGLDVLDRARHYYGPRTGPYHYTLGPTGARLLAAERGTTLADLGYRRDHLLTLLNSPRLAHLVGTNGLFTALAHTSRTLPEKEGLTAWWPETRAAAMWGQFIRPDGYGTWHTAHRRLDFHVEYDTGTEPLTRVLAKLPGYARLATASGIPSPLLIWLPTAGREAHLRARLAASSSHGAVPVVTASPTPTSPDDEPGDLAGARTVWLPLDATRRATLHQLAERYGTLTTPTHDPDDDPPGDRDAPFPRPPADQPLPHPEHTTTTTAIPGNVQSTRLRGFPGQQIIPGKAR